MSNDNYLQITFKVTRETGVISFLMLNGGKLGLLYNKKFERHTETDHAEVVVYYTGSTDLSDRKIKASFEQHAGVIKVEDISLVSKADQRRRPRPEVVAA